MCVEVWQTSNLRRLRLGKEEKDRKKEETSRQNTMSASATQGGHKNWL